MIISNCYYTKSLLNEIDTLIDYGYDYHNLTDADKDKLIAECISCLGSDAYECIIDSDNLNAFLKKFILSCKKDDANDLAMHLRQSATEYFNPVLESLFEERKSNRQIKNNFDHGFFQYMDRNSGETEWLKSA